MRGNGLYVVVVVMYGKNDQGLLYERVCLWADGQAFVRALQRMCVLYMYFI